MQRTSFGQNTCLYRRQPGFDFGHAAWPPWPIVKIGSLGGHETTFAADTGRETLLATCTDSGHRRVQIKWLQSALRWHSSLVRPECSDCCLWLARTQGQQCADRCPSTCPIGYRRFLVKMAIFYEVALTGAEW